MAKIVTYGKKGNYQEVKEKKEEAAKRKRAIAKEAAEKATKPARKRVKVDTVDVTLGNIPLGNILEEETIKIHIPKELRIKDSELEEAEISFTETEKAANDLDYEDYINSVIAEKTSNKKEEVVWDVKKGDPIDYFDPELSYEATGYRPITSTKGLDFDPRPFQLDAETKKRTGKYTSYRFKSLAYNEWWAERDRRCTEGYTYNGYTITGDHYFFLNFYRLQSAMGDSSNDTTEFSQEDDFPSFIVEQYKYFHYIKLAEMSGKDAVALKARGVGFSEIGACLGVNIYTTKKGSNVIYSAFAGNYLEDVLDKCWTQLDWLNLNTEGGFKHLRQVINKQDHKRASVKDKEGTESGWKSDILGIVADMPRKLRGKRCRRLFYEEAGSDPILKKKWDQGEALVTVTGRKVGTRLAWGTGGDMDALAGLGQIFTNPLANNVLPYKHNYTTDNSFIFTGMFIPAFNVVTVPGYIDKRGYTDPELGKSFYNKTREAKKSNAVDYMTYIAEYCFTPDEALSKIVENQFDRDLLIEQKARIELLKTVKLPKRGTVLSTTNDTKDLEFLESPNGKVLMLEKPIKYDYAGNPYKNLYIAGIDSIDQGLDDSTGQKDVSDYCLVIKKRTLGVEGNQYVCIYKDRPKDIRRAYDMTITLLEYYGCQALLENSRTAIITYFKEKKKLNLLMKRPHASMSNVEARTNTMHGVPPTTKTIEHYLELISDYIFDYSYNINFIEMVNELLNYSYERKRKFDIVAAMGMCELADEELSGLGRNTKVQQKDANMRDVGYYTDAYGRKRFGVIPKKEEIIPNDLREFIE